MRLKTTMHRCGVWTCMSAANACWIVLCKCMLDIKCSVLRGWSCAITKSFEFWLRTDEKMGLTLSWQRSLGASVCSMVHRPPHEYAQTPPAHVWHFWYYKRNKKGAERCDARCCYSMQPFHLSLPLPQKVGTSSTSRYLGAS